MLGRKRTAENQTHLQQETLHRLAQRRDLRQTVLDLARGAGAALVILTPLAGCSEIFNPVSAQSERSAIGSIDPKELLGRWQISDGSQKFDVNLNPALEASASSAMIQSICESDENSSIVLISTSASLNAPGVAGEIMDTTENLRFQDPSLPITVTLASETKIRNWSDMAIGSRPPDARGFYQKNRDKFAKFMEKLGVRHELGHACATTPIEWENFRTWAAKKNKRLEFPLNGTLVKAAESGFAVNVLIRYKTPDGKMDEKWFSLSGLEEAMNTYTTSDDLDRTDREMNQFYNANFLSPRYFQDLPRMNQLDFDHTLADKVEAIKNRRTFGPNGESRIEMLEDLIYQRMLVTYNASPADYDQIKKQASAFIARFF